MLRGYEESKLQHSHQLHRQDSGMHISHKLVDLTVEQFTAATGSTFNNMKHRLIEDLQNHNINYLTAAYFLTQKHECDEV